MDSDAEILPRVTLVFYGAQDSERVILLVQDRVEVVVNAEGRKANPSSLQIQGGSMQFELNLDFDLQGAGVGLFNQDEVLIDYAKIPDGFDPRGAWLMFKDPLILPRLPVLGLHPHN